MTVGALEPGAIVCACMFISATKSGLLGLNLLWTPPKDSQDVMFRWGHMGRQRQRPRCPSETAPPPPPPPPSSQTSRHRHTSCIYSCSRVNSQQYAQPRTHLCSQVHACSTPISTRAKDARTFKACCVPAKPSLHPLSCLAHLSLSHEPAYNCYLLTACRMLYVKHNGIAHRSRCLSSSFEVHQEAHAPHHVRLLTETSTSPAHRYPCASCTIYGMVNPQQDK